MREKQLQNSCLSHALGLQSISMTHYCPCAISSKVQTCWPEGFSGKEFLESVIKDKHDDSYTSCIKSATNYAYAHSEIFQLLAHVIWYRLFVLFEEYLSGDGEEVHMTNSNFTFATELAE